MKKAFAALTGGSSKVPNSLGSLFGSGPDSSPPSKLSSTSYKPASSTSIATVGAHSSTSAPGQLSAAAQKSESSAAPGKQSLDSLVSEFNAYSSQLDKLRTSIRTLQSGVDGVCASLLMTAEAITPIASTHAGLQAQASDYLNASTVVATDLLPVVLKALVSLLLRPLDAILASHAELRLRIEGRAKAQSEYDAACADMAALQRRVAAKRKGGTIKGAISAGGRGLANRLSSSVSGLGSSSQQQWDDGDSEGSGSGGGGTTGTVQPHSQGKDVQRQAAVVARLTASHALLQALTDGLSDELQSLSVRRKEVVTRLFVGLSSCVHGIAGGWQAAFRECDFSSLIDDSGGAAVSASTSAALASDAQHATGRLHQAANAASALTVPLNLSTASQLVDLPPPAPSPPSPTHYSNALQRMIDAWSSAPASSQVVAARHGTGGSDDSSSNNNAADGGLAGSNVDGSSSSVIRTSWWDEGGASRRNARAAHDMRRAHAKRQMLVDGVDRVVQLSDYYTTLPQSSSVVAIRGGVDDAACATASVGASVTAGGDQSAASLHRPAAATARDIIFCSPAWQSVLARHINVVDLSTAACTSSAVFIATACDRRPWIACLQQGGLSLAAFPSGLAAAATLSAMLPLSSSSSAASQSALFRSPSGPSIASVRLRFWMRALGCDGHGPPPPWSSLACDRWYSDAAETTGATTAAADSHAPPNSSSSSLMKRLLPSANNIGTSGVHSVQPVDAYGLAALLSLARAESAQGGKGEGMPPHLDDNSGGGAGARGSGGVGGSDGGAGGSSSQHTHASHDDDSSPVRWLTLIEQDVQRSYREGLTYGNAGVMARHATHNHYHSHGHDSFGRLRDLATRALIDGDDDAMAVLRRRARRRQVATGVRSAVRLGRGGMSGRNSDTTHRKAQSLPPSHRVAAPPPVAAPASSSSALPSSPAAPASPASHVPSRIADASTTAAYRSTAVTNPYSPPAASFAAFTGAVTASPAGSAPEAFDLQLVTSPGNHDAAFDVDQRTGIEADGGNTNHNLAPSAMMMSLDEFLFGSAAASASRGREAGAGTGSGCVAAGRRGRRLRIRRSSAFAAVAFSPSNSSNASDIHSGSDGAVVAGAGSPVHGVGEASTTAGAQAGTVDDEASQAATAADFLASRRCELQTVLLAVAASQPELRYTQGMHAVARLLLEVAHAGCSSSSSSSAIADSGSNGKDGDNATTAAAASSLLCTGGGIGMLDQQRHHHSSASAAAVLTTTNMMRALMLAATPSSSTRRASTTAAAATAQSSVTSPITCTPPHLPLLFQPSMVHLRLRLYQLDRLLLRRAPELHSHLDGEGVVVSTYATPWLLTLFASFHCFDAGSVESIWDQFLVQGWPVMFRCCLAILLSLQPLVMDQPMEVCMKVLHAPRNHYASVDWSSNGRSSSSGGYGVASSSASSGHAMVGYRGKSRKQGRVSIVRFAAASTAGAASTSAPVATHLPPSHDHRQRQQQRLQFRAFPPHLSHENDSGDDGDGSTSSDDDDDDDAYGIVSADATRTDPAVIMARLLARADSDPACAVSASDLHELQLDYEAMGRGTGLQ